MKDGDQNKEVKGHIMLGEGKEKKKKAKIEVLVSSVPGEGSLPGVQTATFSLHPHMAFPLSVHRKRSLVFLPLLIKVPALSD